MKIECLKSNLVTENLRACFEATKYYKDLNAYLPEDDVSSF